MHFFVGVLYLCGELFVLLVYGCPDYQITGRCDESVFCFCKNGEWRKTSLSVFVDIASEIKSVGDLCGCTGSQDVYCRNQYYGNKLASMPDYRSTASDANCATSNQATTSQSSETTPHVTTSVPVPSSSETTKPAATDTTKATTDAKIATIDASTGTTDAPTATTDATIAITPTESTTKPSSISSTTLTDTDCCCSREFQSKVEFWRNETNQLIHRLNLESSLIKLNAELRLEKKNLSSIQTLRMCAPDQRVSAAMTGYVGIFIISLILSVPVMIDFPILFANFTKLCACCKKRCS